MPFAAIGHSHYGDLDSFVEAWITHVIQSTPDFNDTFIMPNDTDPPAELSSPSRLSKRRRQASGKDPEATPGAARTGTLFHDTEIGLDPFSESSSTTTSVSRKSGRSSPRKRELVLRYAPNYPVERLNILALSSLHGASESLIQLVSDLYRIGEGETPVIPEVFAESMRAEAPVFSRPPDRWFYPVGSTDSHAELLYRHRRLQTICQSSNKCELRLDHEPEWNDQVHSQILLEALTARASASVDFRNITLSRIRPSFRDPDPALRETKVDYGIFLQPPQNDLLARSLQSYCGVPIAHLALSDDSRTPLAVSIETKSLLTPASQGPSQLANWARAHFCQLAEVIAHQRRETNLLGKGMDESTNHGGTTTKETRGEQLRDSTVAGLGIGDASADKDEEAGLLPILPLVLVYGNLWRVDFAQRRAAKTMIYGSIALGNTHTLHGCYQVCRAIQRLADWAETEFRDWWLHALGVEQGPYDNP